MESPAVKKMRLVTQGRDGCPASVGFATPSTYACGYRQLSAIPSGVFCGLSFVFWTTKFMKPLMTRCRIDDLAKTTAIISEYRV